jgi:hypothetical protein
MALMLVSGLNMHDGIFIEHVNNGIKSYFQINHNFICLELMVICVHGG